MTESHARELRDAGPRRDFVELAAAVDGQIHYQPEPRRRWRKLGRWIGPHLVQAWQIAGATSRGDVLFADSEHLGVPLLLFLRLRSRKPERVAILGHLPGRWWKRVMLRGLTRLGVPGTLLLHSVSQRDLVAPVLSRSWSTHLVAYQADTGFWAAEPTPTDPPTVVAVGSEHRDYETLMKAVSGLDGRVVVAAGSHWARSLVGVDAVPPNVEYTTDVLSFRSLRALYQRATAVVVPLHDVPNQSGITTILEAMSMGIPVIVTASRGQREGITGPLVLQDGTFDGESTADRGPQLFEDRASGAPSSTTNQATGLYVPPADPAALRRALQAIIEDPALAMRLGDAAAESARRSFSLEQFVTAIASVLTGEPSLHREAELEPAR